MNRGTVALTDEETTNRRGATPAAHAVDGVNVSFERARFTAVMGPSGSGKSTLMHCMAGLDRPTSGQAFVGDLDVGRLDDAALTQMRRDRIGFVFQSFNLVPTLTAGENITLPCDLAGRKVDAEWFDYLVSHLGITDRLHHRPSEMSGGQQQRCACARALINRPDLVFADEPTGNLDSNSSAEMLSFLKQSVTELEQSIVMVTHDPHGASYADRVGFVFQSFNLVPTLTAAENITLPLDLAGRKIDKEWFDYLVAQLGIGDRLTHRPTEMSGGQQQRVACARALINRPDLIFADEPTGNLDSNSSAEMMAFLRRSVSDLGQSIVMVTHDPRGAAYADRVLFLADGNVVGELDDPTADSVLERMRTLGT